MGLFKKKAPRVIRKGDGNQVSEVRTVKGETVVVRKSAAPAPTTPSGTATKR